MIRNKTQFAVKRTVTTDLLNIISAWFFLKYMISFIIKIVTIIVISC